MGGEGVGKGWGRQIHDHVTFLSFTTLTIKPHTTQYSIVLINMLMSPCTWLRPIKEVGVIAALPQLHQDVQEAEFLHFASAVDNVNVLH